MIDKVHKNLSNFIILEVTALRVYLNLIYATQNSYIEQIRFRDYNKAI